MEKALSTLLRSFIIILLSSITFSCQEDPPDECPPGATRLCFCPSLEEEGQQECSKGALYTIWKPRTWMPCSCCYEYVYGEHGLHRVNYFEPSGCWDDVYNPATPTYDVGSSNVPPDSEATPPQDR